MSPIVLDSYPLFLGIGENDRLQVSECASALRRCQIHLEHGTLVAIDLDSTEGTWGADQFTLAPNFNVLSFRSNIVLRWEWRPGSTFFLVWQQNRFASGDPTERSRLGNLWDTASAPGDNFFAVKVSYWIPVD
jgi:hypothetical protein